MNNKLIFIIIFLVFISYILSCNGFEVTQSKNREDLGDTQLVRDNTVQYYVHPEGFQDFNLDYTFHGSNPNIAYWRSEYASYITFGGWELWGSLNVPGDGELPTEVLADDSEETEYYEPDEITYEMIDNVIEAAVDKVNMYIQFDIFDWTIDEAYYDDDDGFGDYSIGFCHDENEWLSDDPLDLAITYPDDAILTNLGNISCTGGRIQFNVMDILIDDEEYDFYWDIETESPTSQNGFALYLFSTAMHEILHCYGIHHIGPDPSLMGEDNADWYTD